MEGFIRCLGLPVFLDGTIGVLLDVLYERITALPTSPDLHYLLILWEWQLITYLRVCGLCFYLVLVGLVGGERICIG
jgi:hypothetical protein